MAVMAFAKPYMEQVLWLSVRVPLCNYNFHTIQLERERGKEGEGEFPSLSKSWLSSVL